MAAPKHADAASLDPREVAMRGGGGGIWRRWLRGARGRHGCGRRGSALEPHEDAAGGGGVVAGAPGGLVGSREWMGEGWWRGGGGGGEATAGTAAGDGEGIPCPHFAVAFQTHSAALPR